MYDGEVRINTRLDSGGFNAGIQNIGGALKKVAGAIGIAFSAAAVISFVKTAVDSFSWLASEYSGHLRALNISFMRLRGVVAMLFDTLVSAAAPFLIQAIQWMITMITTLAQVVKGLLEVFLGAGALTGQLDAATDAQGRLTNQTNRLSKAAKGALASFDELHVLSAQPTIPGVSVPPEMTAQLQGFKDAVMGFIQPALDAFDRLRAALTPLGEALFAGLKWAWDNIFVPLGNWAGGQVVPTFLDLLSAALGVVNSVLIAVQPAFQWLWDNVLRPIATWTGGVILDVLKWLTARLNDVSKWFSGNKTDIAAFWDWFGQKAGEAWTFISDIFGRVAEWFQKNFVAPIGDKLGGLIQTMIESGQLMYDRFFKPLGDAFAGVGVTTEGTINSVIGFLKGAFDLIVSIFGDVLTAVADIVSGILEALGGIIKFLTGVFTGDWKMAWEGVQQIFNGIWDALGGIIKGVINIIIDVINALLSATHSALNFIIGGLNSLRFDVPDWVPGIGGQKWGFNVPYVDSIQIPRLAAGAVIPPNAAFGAILGDQTSGRNLEAPEDLIRKIVREESAGAQQITIRFDGTLASFVRELKPYIDDENTRVGVSLVEGVS